MTKLEMEMLEKLMIKYIQEAEKNGFIDTWDNSKPKYPDAILTAVKRAECFIFSYMPENKE